MKRYLLSIFIVAAGLSSCVSDAGLNETAPKGESMKIIAENPTKTVMNGDKIQWESGDQIAVVFPHSTSVPSVNTEFTAEFDGDYADKAVFNGTFDSSVKVANGYQENAFAVYPYTAVDSEGNFVFELPSSQTAVAGGSFPSGYNLASTALSLSTIETTKTEVVAFKNALAYFKVSVDDAVKSVTFTGTSPVTGTAPMNINFSDDPENKTDHGRLVIDPQGKWSSSSNSVTLKPEAGNDNFQSGGAHKYNVLVWPGTHTSLTITLDYGEPYGTFELVKDLGAGYTFETAKYYNLNFPSDLDTILSAAEKDIEIVETDINGLDESLDKVESDIAGLLSQIQSVSYLSDYTENVAYASYTNLYSGISYLDMDFNYMIRPASAAQALVEACEEQDNLSEVFKMVIDDKNGNISQAPVKSVSLDGDVLSVKVASTLSSNFYNGNASAFMALQISDGYTDLISDFTKMFPRMSTSILMTKSEEVPVMMDATVSIPFKFGANDASTCQIVLEPEGFPQDRVPYISQRNNDYKQGYVMATFKTGDNLADMSIKMRITEEDDEFVLPVTFADAGKFVIGDLPTLDYPGGEINVAIDKAVSYGNVTMSLSNASINTDYQTKVGSTTSTATYYNTWIYEKSSGVQGSYLVDENADKFATVTGADGNSTSIQVNWGAQRTANINFSIKNANPGENGDLTYTRSVSVTQKAYGTSINQDNYYSDGEVLQIRTATSQTNKHLNLVILADGYTQSSMQKAGYFYGRANSAADVFLNAIDSEFRDRFNVYVKIRHSANSGIGETLNNGGGYTYYETYKSGTSVNISDTGKAKVKADVKSICSVESYDYYRTVAIVLINTDVNGGASDYEFVGTTSTSNVGDGYTTFGYTMVPANSTGTGGLIRHEVVGHCLGRLGDEYYVDWYTVSLVNERHGYGAYRNIATNASYWSDFTAAGYTAEEVGYHQYTTKDTSGNVVVVNNGLYRSTNDSGIMFDSQHSAFNAVSRWAIYERIRKQTEGPGNYWSDFLEWDKKNK